MLTYEEQLNRDSSVGTRWRASMYFEDEVRSTKRCANLTQALDELDVDYAIAGAMAMFLHGFRRFTEDVDVLVTREGLAKIHEALRRSRLREAICSEQESSRHAHGVKIDFYYQRSIPRRWQTRSHRISSSDARRP